MKATKLLLVLWLNTATSFSPSFQFSGQTRPSHYFDSTTTRRSDNKDNVSRPKFSASSQLQALPGQRAFVAASSNVRAYTRKLMDVTSFKGWSRIRRALLTLMMVSTLWFGSSHVSSAPAHASTSSSATLQERLVKGPSLDKMIDSYVKSNMFSDGAYDPTESTYLEAYHDSTVGSYPSALREVTSSILGDRGSLSKGLSEAKSTNVLGSVMAILQKQGLSQMAAAGVIAVTGLVALPFTFVFGFFIFGTISKRNLNKLFKSRYGENYTVDATIKKEETVEAPDDDDDDDDDDDE